MFSWAASSARKKKIHPLQFVKKKQKKKHTRMHNILCALLSLCCNCHFSRLPAPTGHIRPFGPVTFRTQTIKERCNAPRPHYKPGQRAETCGRSESSAASDGLLIQHLSHSETPFVQLGFFDGGSRHTPRRHARTHARAHVLAKANQAPGSDITPHTSPCPTLRLPALGNHPEPVQPPQRDVHAPGRQPDWVEGRGGGGFSNSGKGKSRESVLEGARRVLIGGFGW